MANQGPGPNNLEPALIARFQRGRKDPAWAILEGFHALKHAFRFGAEIEGAWAPDPDQVMALATTSAPDVRDRLARCVHPVAASIFETLAPVPPSTGVIAIARRPMIKVARILERSAAAPVVLLEAPSHLGNVGAVIRVAAAAGAAAVLTTGRLDPWHPAALRGAAGLHFALPVARVQEVPASDRPLLAVDPDGEPLGPDGIPDRAILAFGSERRGLGPVLLAAADRRIAIPMREGVSSLNLATAVAVILYAWRLGRPG